MQQTLRDSLSDEILKARDLLTTETWRKGRYFSSEGSTICMCAHGAMQSVVNTRVRDVLENATKSTNTRAGAAHVVAAADFNDNPSTTLEMVREKFLEAANLAKLLNGGT